MALSEMYQNILTRRQPEFIADDRNGWNGNQ